MCIYVYWGGLCLNGIGGTDAIVCLTGGCVYGLRARGGCVCMV